MRATIRQGYYIYLGTVYFGLVWYDNGRIGCKPNSDYFTPEELRAVADALVTLRAEKAGKPK